MKTYASYAEQAAANAETHAAVVELLERHLKPLSWSDWWGGRLNADGTTVGLVIQLRRHDDGSWTELAWEDGFWGCNDYADDAALLEECGEGYLSELRAPHTAEELKARAEELIAANAAD